MLKKAVIHKCSVNSTNAYDNSSNIDFLSVYEDYHYLPATI